MDKITNDARVYTDVQGLEQLRGKLKSDPKGVQKEVAQQFEGLLLQMVLRSMRDANKSFAPDSGGGNDMSYYQDMFDKQLTLMLSNKGLGLADAIERNIDASKREADMSHVTELKPNEMHNTNIERSNPMYALPDSLVKPHTGFNLTLNDKNTINRQHVKHQLTPTITALPSQPLEKKSFLNQQDFVRSLWHSAKEAAATLGVNPAVLVAQAALETDWGNKILKQANGESTHNLFNIKADNHWHQSVATTATLEQKNGILVKEKSHFRSYGSFTDSFHDYAQFIKNNGRYTKAVENAVHPKQYVEALQEAGYATDNHYARKIIDILVSPNFQSLINNIK